MKLIRLHHVQLELQASTLATTLGATPAPVDTPLLSFFAFSLLCRSLRCLRAIQFAVPARFAFFPTVFAHVNRNVWRPTMLPHTPTHKHTHGGRQTMCAHYTQFYTFFLRLACTCNAALFNIKWRLIPGSTSSQSTHTHTDPFPPSLPQPERSSAAAAALGAATGAVCTSAGCRDEQRRGGWGSAYEWLGS